MSRSVCPWCQNPYVENEDSVLVCKNTDCRACAEEFLHKELDRTRKALEIAKKALQELKDIIACPPDIPYETGVSMYADGELQEITALEQKD